MTSIQWTELVLLPTCMVMLSAIGAQGQSSAQTKTLLNVDAQGVGAHGYDPVAFFTEGKAVKGDPHWQTAYGGAIYYFQSSADKEVFERQPAKYAPQYGGYCAMAMTMGKLEDVDPNYFLVHRDRLLFQRNEKAHKMFSKDPDANHKKADESWAKLQQTAN